LGAKVEAKADTNKMETAAVTSFIVSVLSHFAKLNFSIRRAEGQQQCFTVILLRLKNAFLTMCDERMMADVRNDMGNLGSWRKTVWQVVVLLYSRIVVT
jgi:hypothetical protein